MGVNAYKTSFPRRIPKLFFKAIKFLIQQVKSTS